MSQGRWGAPRAIVAVALVVIVATAGLVYYLYTGSHNGNSTTSETTTFKTTSSSATTAKQETTLDCVGAGGASLYDPFNKLVYVQSSPIFGHGLWSWSYTSVINGTKLVGSIPAVGPMVCNPTNGYVYMVQLKLPENNYSLLVVHGLTVLSNLSLPVGVQVIQGISQVGPMVYNPINNCVYLAINDITGNRVVVVQGTSILKTVTLNNGRLPIEALTVNPSDGLLYVGTSYFPLTIINGSSIQSHIKVNQNDTFPIVYDPSNGDVYVGGGRDNLSVIAGDSVVATISASVDAGDLSCIYYCTTEGPLQYDSGNGYVYAVLSIARCCALYVINGSSVAATIGLQGYDWMVVNPFNHDLYLQNGYSTTTNGTITVISGTKISASLTIETVGIVADPVNGYVYALGYEHPQSPTRISNSTLVVIANGTIVADVKLGAVASLKFALDPSTGLLYLPLRSASGGRTTETLAVVNGTSIIATINLPP